jgi:hypothetical protein
MGHHVMLLLTLARIIGFQPALFLKHADTLHTGSARHHFIFPIHSNLRGMRQTRQSHNPPRPNQIFSTREYFSLLHEPATMSSPIESAKAAKGAFS